MGESPKETTKVTMANGKTVLVNWEEGKRIRKYPALSLKLKKRIGVFMDLSDDK